MSRPDSGSQPDAVIRLVRALELTSGPGLFIIVGLLDAERQTAADQVRAILGGEVEERDLSRPPSMEEAVEVFFSPCEKRGVIVTHFETWLTYESRADGSMKLTEEAQRFLSKINFGRPRLGKIGKPCLLLVPPFVTELLADWAPDFYDFRLMEAVLHDRGCEPISVKPFMESGYEPRPYRLTANREERQAWIQELKERLADAGDKGSPHDWVRLYKLLREDGADTEALEALDRSIVLWSNELDNKEIGKLPSRKTSITLYHWAVLEKFKFVLLTKGASQADYTGLLELERGLRDWRKAKPRSIKILRTLAQVLGEAADFEATYRGEYHSARDKLLECLTIYRQLLKAARSSTDDLVNIAVTLERLGDLSMNIFGDIEGAMDYFNLSLGIRNQIVEQVGESEMALSAKAIALERLGDLECQPGRSRERAFKLYEESFLLSKRILELAGDTPKSLRNIFVASTKLGDFIMEENGDVISAMVFYRLGHDVARLSVERFGRTPLALRDYSVTLDRLGDMELQVSQEKVKAQSWFEESYQVRKQKLSEFGSSPETLEDLSLSAFRLAEFVDVPCLLLVEAYHLMRERNREYRHSVQSQIWEEAMAGELIKQGCEAPVD